MFMKRMGCGIQLKDLYIGSIVNVHSRQLKLVEYGDVFTKNNFESRAERTFAIIKPDCYTQTGKIIDAIYQNGFTISKLKMSKFSRPQQTDEFYQEHKGKPFFADLSAFMQSDVVTGLELVGDNAVQNFRSLLGPTDSKSAPKNTLRGIFGTDGMRNAVHASASASDFNRECSLFFNK